MSITDHEVPQGRTLADYLERNARLLATKTAIIYPDGCGAAGDVHYSELSYDALQSWVEDLAAGLLAIGVAKGTKTVLMAPPGPELFALAFALFRIGAVPVVVDPGMGVKRMLHCYRAVGAEAFIGPSLAHAVRVFSPRTFARIRIRVTLGRRWFWGGHTLDRLPPASAQPGEEGPTPDDLMMIGFTTGSTGPAKGVEYTHRMAAAMARQVKTAHSRNQDEVSLITLPLYGMLDLVFGSTLVLAPVAPAKVAAADPAPVVAALKRFKVSTMFASPALLRVLGEHLTRHPTHLPALRCLVSGGAPVPPDLLTTLRTPLGEQVEIKVGYGSTEVLPISSIESAEILQETAARAALGDGTCVGRPIPGTKVRIIQVTDDPLPRWNASLPSPPGQVGEIVVAGESVSRHYHATPGADTAFKIHEDTGDGPPRLWHRTGDLGYLDATGRLWFCGRKAQRVRTTHGDLHTVRCEGVFNAHPLIRRTALVGIGEPGSQRPVLCVETEPGIDAQQFATMLPELRQLAAAQPLSEHLRDFLHHPAFPVDVRHNAKIGREQLAHWAEQQLAATGVPRRHRWAPRAIPLAGWAYLAAAVIHPFHSPLPASLWWIDAFLSIVVHAAQIPHALPRARAAGRKTAGTVALTMLYGATWWRQLPKPAPARPRQEAAA
ncbi:hypothetical protein DY245_01770 [Streptomyces inhibens]|uniref:AMP-dependent synthetase/ligase domain-containing protein n=2 Tax=Streptomyces inhibens TaxID=2293571 RepID=A0A371QBT0_STRIH|nr:hypothetical protein DY245_01770 [Streptomyces inhibens]